MTKAELLRVVQAQVADYGSQRKAAAAWHISVQYLSDILRKRREPGEKLLAALGLERVIDYRERKHGWS